MTQEDILSLLHQVVHPELHSDIVTLGMVENVVVTADKIQFSLCFARARDPFARSIKSQCENAITQQYPNHPQLQIFIKEKTPTPQPKATPQPFGVQDGVKHILAVSSAKGGVGKSTVTANLALALHAMNYRVGILDADIYGPSQPTLFGVEGYQPVGEKQNGKEWILPAEKLGIRLMSIGFFIRPSDALMWRGPMATNALRQMIRQTLWGPLDFLLIDLPPGTGDVHLSILQEMQLQGALIVSTPQKVALDDVVRGIAMFRSEKIQIPVLGLVENMAWFTPAELPDHRYYIFGKEGAKKLAAAENLPLLAQIPLIQAVREASDEGEPLTANHPSSHYYRLLAEAMIAQLPAPKERS
ncbi:MAG: Mrp/NBP35 family ATP-binding protein [Alistipes sp.]|nr:Mrp/NBP35 family ATP-binding protein [Alistipes sp.]